MRIAVMGSGGMGGYFGGLLARAGKDVTFVARGAHLAAIRAQGLTVRSAQAGDFSVQVPAIDDPATIGEVDLVLFCVKTYDLESAAQQIRPLIGDHTLVLPVQNGIESPDRIARIVGPAHVLGGVSYVGASIQSPGVIVQAGISGKLLYGELTAGTSSRAAQLLATFQEAGIQAEHHSNIRTAMWEKFIVVCATGGVMALMRLPLGPIVDCAESRALFLSTMKEVEAVARAKGMVLPDGTAQRLFDYLVANMAPSGRSSQAIDLAAGRRLELEALNGAVVRLGREAGVPTPLNFAIYAALKPYINGPPALPA